MEMETTLPHSVIDAIPIIDLTDPVTQNVLDMDYATSEVNVSMYANVYRTCGKHPKYLLGEQVFFSKEEAYANAETNQCDLVYEGVLPITVHQVKQAGCYWGQNPALAKESDEAFRKIKLTRVKSIDDF